ncbi:MAG: hypothetical protein PVG04_01175 [Anaerolineales bacterium]|jgi:hypothetical protein
MRVWSLPLDAPLTLTLAADSRSDDFDPDNDQIWQLFVSEREPAGIALHSTYGLRAKSIHILPAFELDGKLVQRVQDFASPPLIHAWLPSYISLDLWPFPELQVHAEYWVQTSSLLAGRYTFTNRGEGTVRAALRIYSILKPNDSGMPISSTRDQGVQILSGRTGDLAPLIFLQGGARSEPGAYPSLSVQTHLMAGENHSWIWAHSGADSIEQGIGRSREMLESNWDAERARMLMEYSDLVEVQTGHPDWDAALWAAQREARNLFLRPNRKLKHAVPVQSRTLKDGCAGESGGSTWEPASPWEAFYSALQILPGAPEWVAGYIETMLRLQEGDGHIPVMTDFSSPHDGWLFPPLLAQLTQRLYRRTGDKDLLRTSFSALHSLFERWFESDHDRDGDGFPEWDHVNQAGFKSWPAFSPWFEWSKGLELSSAETTDLGSLLILEGEALLAIAAALGLDEQVQGVLARVEFLKERLESSWVEGVGYKHVDFYLHESVVGRRLAVRRGEFNLDINREFDPAVRVLFQVEGPEENVGGIRVLIHSRGRRGPSRVEKYGHRDFRWFLDCGYLTSDKPSAAIEEIEVKGIDRKFRTEISLADYSREDIMQLLPLTAGVPVKERADMLVQEILQAGGCYWRSGGIPSIPANDPDYALEANKWAGTVNLLRNHWIGEGLLRYGYESEAGDLMEKLLQTVTMTLQAEHAFSGHYDGDGKRVLRDNGAAGGLTPFALLLEVLGVELITPRKVRVKPGNPLSRPVRITWRGLQIDCEKDVTRVTFPDGGSTEVTGDSISVVEQLD